MIQKKDIDNLIFDPAFYLLPPKMWSPEAEVMLLAIGLQESRFKYRVQLIGNHRNWWESLKGPARGFWQFERAGIYGVLNHHATQDFAYDVLGRLQYPTHVGTIHRALAHNDVLACCFARLLLWTLPGPLPKIEATGYTPAQHAWDYYLEAWRPGRPHKASWLHFWQDARHTVTREV